MIYDPNDWYWLRDDGALYSSAAQALAGADDPAYLAWIEAGNRATRWPEDESGAQTEAALAEVLAAAGRSLWGPAAADLIMQGAAIVQSHLDATARQRRYDSIQTAVSYRNDPNPIFAAEGEAMFTWRSAVWTAALAILADVEAGETAIPSAADLIAALPVMVWPEAA